MRVLALRNEAYLPPLGWTEPADPPLKLHDLLFLLRQQLVDLFGQPIRDDLDDVLPLFDVILRGFLLPLLPLERLVGIPASVPDRHPTLLGDLPNHLDQLLAAFLRQGRDRNPDELPVVGRRDAQIRLEDRLLNGGEQ